MRNWGKLGTMLIIFGFICFLVYQEYHNYQKEFENTIPTTKEIELVVFKNIKIKKQMEKQLLMMSKSAGRDLVELQFRYGYLTEEEIKQLQDERYSEFADGYSIEISSKKTDHLQKMQAWLEKHAYQYGFIMRYPPEKEPITKKVSTTIYTYVGIDVAEIMYKENLCYEEYMERV